MDANLTPGDDFFAYANGGWLKATAIPAGKERWSNRDELEALSRRRIAELLDAASAAPAGSEARKVADYRAAYLNEAAIEARGLESLRPVFERIEKVSDRAELTRLLGRSMRADVDPMGFGVYQSAGVLGLAVQQSIHGEKTNTAFLVQGGLGLPDREDYLSAEAGKDALRGRYREYIAKMLALAGFTSRMNVRARCWRWKPRSRRARARATRRRTTAMPTTCGRVPTSRSGRPEWTGPSSSTRRAWPGRQSSSSGSRPP